MPLVHSVWYVSLRPNQVEFRLRLGMRQSLVDLKCQPSRTVHSIFSQVRFHQSFSKGRPRIRGQHCGLPAGCHIDCWYWLPC